VWGGKPRDKKETQEKPKQCQQHHVSKMDEKRRSDIGITGEKKAIKGKVGKGNSERDNDHKKRKKNNRPHPGRSVGYGGKKGDFGHKKGSGG